jgi:hypothetical protein
VEANITEYVLKNEYDLLIGATYNMKNSSITGLFSSEYQHSPPLALNLVYQSIIKDKLGPYFGTVVTIDPCTSLMNNDIEEFQSTRYLMEMINYLGIIIPFLWTNKLVIFYVKETSTGVKAMYLANGLSRWVYYISNMLFDIISFFVIISIDTIFPRLIFYFKDKLYAYFMYHLPSIITYYIPAYFYELAHLYFFVMFFQKAFNAQVAITLFYIFTGEFF